MHACILYLVPVLWARHAQGALITTQFSCPEDPLSKTPDAETGFTALVPCNGSLQFDTGTRSAPLVVSMLLGRRFGTTVLGYRLNARTVTGVDAVPINPVAAELQGNATTGQALMVVFITQLAISALVIVRIMVTAVHLNAPAEAGKEEIEMNPYTSMNAISTHYF